MRKVTYSRKQRRHSVRGTKESPCSKEEREQILSALRKSLLRGSIFSPVSHVR